MYLVNAQHQLQHTPLYALTKCIKESTIQNYLLYYCKVKLSCLYRYKFRWRIGSTHTGSMSTFHVNPSLHVGDFCDTMLLTDSPLNEPKDECHTQKTFISSALIFQDILTFISALYHIYVNVPNHASQENFLYIKSHFFCVLCWAIYSEIYCYCNHSLP